MTGSLQQLVMMDETISYVKRILQGIEVTPETLAVEVIDRVGPAGPSSPTTTRSATSERNPGFPGLMDRNRRARWEAEGSTTLAARAQTRLNALLDSHRPAPLSASVQQRIAEVLAGADARLQSKPS